MNYLENPSSQVENNHTSVDCNSISFACFPTKPVRHKKTNVKSISHDHCATNKGLKVENVYSFEIFNLLNHSGTETHATNMTQSNNIDVTKIDPMEDELVTLHYFACARCSIRMKDPKIVSLSRLIYLASSVRFEIADTSFGHSVKRDVPVLKNFDEFSTASNLNSLISSDKNQKSFQNFFLLPPCLSLAFLSAFSRFASDLVCVIKAALEVSTILSANVLDSMKISTTKSSRTFLVSSSSMPKISLILLHFACNLMRPSCHGVKLHTRFPCFLCRVSQICRFSMSPFLFNLARGSLVRKKLQP